MSQHGRENAQLLQAIKHSHETNDGTYGPPHVVHDLMDAGFACSENRVARLIKVAGIKARHKRRRTPGQLEAAVHSIAPKLLDRSLKQLDRIRSGRPTSLMSGLAKAGTGIGRWHRGG